MKIVVGFPVGFTVSDPDKTPAKYDQVLIFSFLDHVFWTCPGEGVPLRNLIVSAYLARCCRDFPPEGKILGLPRGERGVARLKGGCKDFPPGLDIEILVMPRNFCKIRYFGH